MKWGYLLASVIIVTSGCSVPFIANFGIGLRKGGKDK